MRVGIGLPGTRTRGSGACPGAGSRRRQAGLRQLRKFPPWGVSWTRICPCSDTWAGGAIGWRRRIRHTAGGPGGGPKSRSRRRGSPERPREDHWPPRTDASRNRGAPRRRTPTMRATLVTPTSFSWHSVRRLCSPRAAAGRPGVLCADA
eukprot:5557752-Pyramimonas_sp.AAC.1